MPSPLSSETKVHAPTLTEHLAHNGFFLHPVHTEVNEGFISEAQKEQFSLELANYSGIKSVLEIGLNAGHSAEHLLLACPSLQKFVSCDLNIHPYTCRAAEYLKEKYKDIFMFIEGDSRFTIPSYKCRFPDHTFDLIYIDGDHTYEGCMADIYNCRALSSEHTRLWIDDFHLLGPSHALLGAQVEGIIEVLAYHSSEDAYGKRHWAEARYLF